MLAVSDTSPLSNLAIIGLLPSLKPELKRLRDEAGFFIDHEIERFILSEAGE